MNTVIELHHDFRADDKALAEVIPQVFMEVAEKIGPAGVVALFAGYKESVESYALAA